MNTTEKMSLKNALSLIAFSCYSYIVLENQTNKLFWFVTIAYTLTALYTLLPAIWQTDQLKWRIKIPMFAILSCVSWAIAFVMTLLSVSVLCAWGQWAMLLVAYFIIILLCFSYQYKD